VPFLFFQIFFVLRKKDEHVSLLHVVHHGIMPMSVWFGVRFTPGGHSTFFGLLNTFVHIVMYFYYMVAAMGPQYQKFIWWKKYLTAFQMVRSYLSLSLPLLFGKKVHRFRPHPLPAACCKLMFLPGNRCGLLALLFDRSSVLVWCLVFLDVS
jgi:phosphatidylglycerophosphate synthase